MCKVIRSGQDELALQGDLQKLEKWAGKWKIRFNNGNCKVLLFGRKNKQAIYYLNGTRLSQTEEERDFGVVIDNKVKMGAQCRAVASKANKIIACIKRGIDAREESITLSLYKSLVRPHLEYGALFWGPISNKDIADLEKVQRRARKIIRGMEILSYEERLAKLGPRFGVWH